MTLDELEQGGVAGLLTCEHAWTFLHGCVRVEREPQGWMRPCRFTEVQERLLGSCQAWHPGLYRQMARCASGITLEFDTDASEVALELRVDEMSSGARKVVREAERWQAAGHPERGMPQTDGITLEVDERLDLLPMPSQGSTVLTLTLDDPQDRPRPDVYQLPLLVGDRRVRLWLPLLHGCTLRRIWCNGSHMTPVAPRRLLLVLGDSLAQGFVVGSPSHSWPAQLARRLGCDLLNQSVGGQVFQPGMVLSAPEGVDPHAIVIALGANYRYEPCSERLVEADVRLFLANVARSWPTCPTWVATPTWHDERMSRSHPKSCWQRVPTMVATHVGAHREMRMVDGSRLLDAEPSLLSDGYEHLGVAGATQVADRMQVFLRSNASMPQEVLRDRARTVLGAAPRTAFALNEAIRRMRAEVLLAEEGCVMARVPAGELMLWATDERLARAALAMLADASDVVCDLHTPTLAGELGQRFGWARTEPYHLAVYEREEPVPSDDERVVRVLDASFLSMVMGHYSHADWLDEHELRRLMDDGRFLGAFEDDELVGFIGEHTVGAMGLLEVFPGHRRRGWAAALETCQINRTLERGDVPWAQVYPHNRTSLRLQRSLGLTVTPAAEQCFVSRGLGEAAGE